MAEGSSDRADRSQNDAAAKNESLPSMSFPHLPVMEKVIFCIDTFYQNNTDSQDSIADSIRNLIDSYCTVKKVLTKHVDYQFMYLTKQKLYQTKCLQQKKEINNCLTNDLKKYQSVEKQPYDFSVLFKHLAINLILPNDEHFCESLPPPYVYHIILLFTHNKYPPVLKNTNAFNFLMGSPFLVFDTLYIYDSSLEEQNCMKIAETLKGLNGNHKGYFATADKHDIHGLHCAVSQFLGHPLIRVTQNLAKFSILNSQNNNCDKELDD